MVRGHVVSVKENRGFSENGNRTMKSHLEKKVELNSYQDKLYVDKSLKSFDDIKKQWNQSQK